MYIYIHVYVYIYIHGCINKSNKSMHVKMSFFVKCHLVTESWLGFRAWQGLNPLHAQQWQETPWALVWSSSISSSPQVEKDKLMIFFSHWNWFKWSYVQLIWQCSQTPAIAWHCTISYYSALALHPGPPYQEEPYISLTFALWSLKCPFHRGGFTSLAWIGEILRRTWVYS